LAVVLVSMFVFTAVEAQAAYVTVKAGDTVEVLKRTPAYTKDAKLIGYVSSGTRLTVLTTERPDRKDYIHVRNSSGQSGYISASTDTVRVISTSQTTTKADRVIQSGLKYLGTPYRFGASSSTTSVFDCSSFTQRIFGENGVTLPRSSRQQATVGTRVSLSNVKKGDLIFFKTSGGSQIDHVAVYMGDGRILHAIPKGGVQISSFSGFWKRTAVSARRVL